MSAIGQAGSPSILFARREDRLDAQSANAPPFSADLNFNQIVAAVTSAGRDHDLKPFFYFSLNQVDAIHYRHEVFQDLEMPVSVAKVKSFTQRMHDVRVLLALVNKLHDRLHRECWFLHAVGIYCEPVKHLPPYLSDPPVNHPRLF